MVADDNAPREQTESLRRLWWAVPAAAVIIFLTLVILLDPGKEVNRELGTSYDSSPGGFRAAYLILDELDFPARRSKRLGDVDARWVLAPNKALADAHLLAPWLERGGVLVLADGVGEWSKDLGIHLKIESAERLEPQAALVEAEGIGRLAVDSTYVSWPDRAGAVWAQAEGRPLVTVYPRGRGSIWLIHRPAVLSNAMLLRARETGAGNAVLLSRLAEAIMADGRVAELAFDEYFHGLRDRPGIVELLLTPPTLWVTLQGSLLLALILWHYLPRFGAIEPAPETRRRSKREFLDAMAALLSRKGDLREAERSVRDSLLHEIQLDLGLAGGTPVDQVLQEAARRRPGCGARLQQVLGAPAAALDKKSFLHSLNNLEAARDEYFHRRNHR